VHVIDVLRGKETERVQRWDHQQLGVFGVGADLDEAAWRDVFRQLVALGLVRIDHGAFGALRLTPASRAVLKGEQKVEMRRAAPRLRRTKKSRVATAAPASAQHGVPAGGAPNDAVTSTDPAAEAGRYARLRAWRLEEARRQALPAYVILHDATLAEIARRRPRDLDSLAGIPGIGARKLERYGPALLDLLSGD
jgi:ATP-dependent DNA helicase RecQ